MNVLTKNSSGKGNVKTFKTIFNRFLLPIFFAAMHVDYHCFSAVKSATVINSQSPVFNESRSASLVGNSKVVFNLLSTHLIGTDTFMGQAVIDLEKFHISNGKSHQFDLTLGPMVEALYDTKGQPLKGIVNREDACGTLRVDLTIPTIYSNMCGWWWNVTTNFIGVVVSILTRCWLYLKLLCDPPLSHRPHSTLPSFPSLYI